MTCLPTSGRFPLSTLAGMLGVHRDTLRRWVQQYNCPFKQPGEEMWIDVVDLWESWPRQTPAETPKRSGGYRRKN